MCVNNDEYGEEFIEDDGCIRYEDLQIADDEFVVNSNTNICCQTCLVPEHDVCSMTHGCPCCENTKQTM